MNATDVLLAAAAIGTASEATGTTNFTPLGPGDDGDGGGGGGGGAPFDVAALVDAMSGGAGAPSAGGGPADLNITLPGVEQAQGQVPTATQIQDAIEQAVEDATPETPTVQTYPEDYELPGRPGGDGDGLINLGGGSVVETEGLNLVQTETPIGEQVGRSPGTFLENVLEGTNKGVDDVASYIERREEEADYSVTQAVEDAREQQEEKPSIPWSRMEQSESGGGPSLPDNIPGSNIVRGNIEKFRDAFGPGGGSENGSTEPPEPPTGRDTGTSGPDEEEEEEPEAVKRAKRNFRRLRA